MVPLKTGRRVGAGIAGGEGGPPMFDPPIDIGTIEGPLGAVFAGAQFKVESFSVACAELEARDHRPISSLLRPCECRRHGKALRFRRRHRERNPFACAERRQTEIYFYE